MRPIVVNILIAASILLVNIPYARAATDDTTYRRYAALAITIPKQATLGQLRTVLPRGCSVSAVSYVDTDVWIGNMAQVTGHIHASLFFLPNGYHRTLNAVGPIKYQHTNMLDVAVLQLAKAPNAASAYGESAIRALSKTLGRPTGKVYFPPVETDACGWVASWRFKDGREVDYYQQDGSSLDGRDETIEVIFPRCVNRRYPNNLVTWK